MPNKKQKVKIFRRKYGKHPKTGQHCMLEGLEQVINNFLKENPDHRITHIQYNATMTLIENESVLIRLSVFSPQGKVNRMQKIEFEFDSHKGSEIMLCKV